MEYGDWPSGCIVAVMGVFALLIIGGLAAGAMVWAHLAGAL